MMRKFIFIFCILLLSAKSTAWVTTDQVNKVYSKIIKIYTLKNYPRLQFLEGWDEEAQMFESTAYFSLNKNTITFTFILLEEIQNEDEIASILLHELGHWANSDVGDKLSQELRADRFSVYYISKVGYNKCKGLGWIKRGNFPKSKYYPSSKQRLRNASC